jgi:hypothetical protein
MGHIMHHLWAKMIYSSSFIVSWSDFLYNHFLMLVPRNHQESLIMFSFKIWLYFAWIRINMWIHINISYLKISQHRAGLSTSNNFNPNEMDCRIVGAWLEIDFLLSWFTHHLLLQSYKVLTYGSLKIKGVNVSGDLLGDPEALENKR